MLIARGYPEILATEDVADDRKHRKGIWHSRYRSIVDLEHPLARNGTRIVKFYLHLSKNEQRKRFLDRIDQPDKNWKSAPATSRSAATGRNTWRPTRRAWAPRARRRRRGT